MKKMKSCKKIRVFVVLMIFCALLTGCTREYYFPGYVLGNKTPVRYVRDNKDMTYGYCEDMYADGKGNLVCILTGKQKKIILGKQEECMEWMTGVLSEAYGAEVSYNKDYTDITILCKQKEYYNEIVLYFLREFAVVGINFQVLKGVELEDLYVKVTVLDGETQEIMCEYELSEAVVNNAEIQDYIMPAFVVGFAADAYDLYDKSGIARRINDREQFLGMYEFVFIDEYNDITFRLTEEQRKAWFDMMQDEYLADGIDVLADMGCDVEYSDDFKTAQVSCTEELVSEMCVPEEDGDIPYKEVTKHLALPLMMSQIFSGVQSEDLMVTISFVDADTGDTITEVNYAPEKE